MQFEAVVTSMSLVATMRAFICIRGACLSCHTRFFHCLVRVSWGVQIWSQHNSWSVISTFFVHDSLTDSFPTDMGISLFNRGKWPHLQYTTSNCVESVIETIQKNIDSLFLKYCIILLYISSTLHGIWTAKIYFKLETLKIIVVFFQRTTTLF